MRRAVLPASPVSGASPSVPLALNREQSHSDHIGLDELAAPDAGVKSFGGDSGPVADLSWAWYHVLSASHRHCLHSVVSAVVRRI